jgi:hypothetical protein
MPTAIDVCKCGHSAAEHGYSKALPCTTSPCTCPRYQHKPKPRRYFIDHDESGHWYVIPLAKAEAWEERCQWEEEEDERAWDTPEWLQPIDGHPNSITFENPSKQSQCPTALTSTS